MEWDGRGGKASLEKNIILLHIKQTPFLFFTHASCTQTQKPAHACITLECGCSSCTVLGGLWVGAA